MGFVLISTLGSNSVDSLNGFVIGPEIAAMLIAVWDMSTVTRSAFTDRQRSRFRLRKPSGFR